jgi:hypothetical protein
VAVLNKHAHSFDARLPYRLFAGCRDAWAVRDRRMPP